MNKESRNSVLALALPLLPLLLLIAGAVFLVSSMFGSKEKKMAEMSGIPVNSGEITGIPPVSALKPTSNPATNQTKSQNNRHLMMRENLEMIFRQGALTRNQAVEALKQLGFSRSAAYEALSEKGRFAFLLHFDPDGIIALQG